MRPHENDPTEGREAPYSFSAQLAAEDEITETIDINNIFYEYQEEEDSTGNFDPQRLSLAPFGKLLHAIPVPTLLIGRSHAIEFANASFLELSKDKFSMRGTTFSSLFPNPVEARKAQLELEDVFVKRKPLVEEKVLKIHKTKIWGRVHLRTIRLGDSPKVLVQVENLTAEKRFLSIQKYKKLMKMFPIGIAEFGVTSPLPPKAPHAELLDAALDARVVDGNDEFSGIYRRGDISQLLGVSLRQLYPDEGNARSIYAKWVARGFPIVSFNTSESGFAGGTRRFENTLIANINNELFLGFWWLKKDVSDKKRTEEELLKTQKLESLGILAGGIAHDFNNLLTAILGNISLGEGYSQLSEKSVERFEAASRAASRAQDLTYQLLTFSKGGAPIKKTAPISHLLRDCATFVLRGSNVRCEFIIPDELWPVQIDEGQISQVVNNLVINAAQAMADGGTITVQAENVTVEKDPSRTLRKGKYVKVSITDRGVGILNEHMRKIFDPYFTTKEKGSGLGLAVSYSIIKRHGGVIKVSSRVDVGSTFDFFLPANESDIPAEETKEVRVFRGKGRILVMDDDEMILDVASELLTTLGYQVEAARDGAEAIRLYAEAMKAGNRFDAVIMDLTVPGGMSGKDAIAVLLKMDPLVKAIVSSGYSNSPVMSDHAAYGFRAVLTKPYDAQQMSQRLEELLNLPT
ncbi:MAG: response regulator [Desulfomonile tiedjei]|nr:response regulator [Desulfomonile tiedjei]